MKRQKVEEPESTQCHNVHVGPLPMTNNNIRTENLSVKSDPTSKTVTKHKRSGEDWKIPIKVAKRNLIEDECQRKKQIEMSNQYEILSDDDDDIPDVVTVDSISDCELNEAGGRFKENDTNTESHNKIQVPTPAVLMHEFSKHCNVTKGDASHKQCTN